MDFTLKIILAYLLGSVVGSLLVGRLRGGVDIRKLGSGNPGSTNALRTQGLAFGIWVIVIDVVKGWIAAALLPGLAIPGIPPASGGLADWLGATTDPSAGLVAAQLRRQAWWRLVAAIVVGSAVAIVILMSTTSTVIWWGGYFVGDPSPGARSSGSAQQGS